MTRKEIFLCSLYTNVLTMTTLLARAAASAEQTIIVPRSPSLEPLKQVSLYLDRSSAELDLFLELVETGEPATARAALATYTHEFSRFHVALGRLRMGKAERVFVPALETQPSSKSIPFQFLLGHRKGTFQMILCLF